MVDQNSSAGSNPSGPIHQAPPQPTYSDVDMDIKPFGASRSLGVSVAEYPNGNTSGSSSTHEKSMPPPPPLGLTRRQTSAQLDSWTNQWTNNPRSLAPGLWEKVIWDAYDVVLVLLPIALIIKAGLCVLAWEHDKTHRGANFDQTSKLTINLIRFNMELTTLFTIVFVLIIASTVKRFALWKAQHGAKLADLEQFNSSVSLTATFKAIFFLRAFSWVSVFLLFVWSWYYVGSQACEREYTFQEGGAKQALKLAHVSNSATSPLLDGPLKSFPTVKQTDLTSRYHLYIGRVETGVSKSAFDINGYPLTPYYDNQASNRLDDKHARRIDVEGWLDTTQFSSQHVLNSIGTTLYTNFLDPKSSNFSSGWTDGHIIGEFTYETTNFFANCSHTSLLKQSTYPGLIPTMTISLNITNQTGPITPETTRSFTVWELYNQTHSLQATCALSELHTDVRVRCSAVGCKAIAVRPTKGKPYPILRTPFDSDKFAQEFFNDLLLASGTPTSLTDLTMLEADNGWEPLKRQLKLDEAAGSVNTDADIHDESFSWPLSIALTNHINTYYTATMYMKFEHTNEQTMMQDDHFTIASTDTNYTILDVHGAEVSLRYEISWPWIAVDIVSNIVLLIAAIFAFWLRRKTLAPDLFGYVSSLTRDNPHIQLEGGSALSGMERARKMGKLKVKLGDIGPRDGGVGRIVMTHNDDPMLVADEPGIRRLQRTRTYA